MQFKRIENVMQTLMLGLLYPAVLGSIFYSIVSSLPWLGGPVRVHLGVSQVPYVAMMATVIVFFSVDFLYTFVQEKYGLVEFSMDLVILCLMQLAFTATNFLSKNESTWTFSVCMAITCSIFFIWDCRLLNDRKAQALRELLKKILAFEALAAAVFAAIALWHGGVWLTGIVAVVATAMLIALFGAFLKILPYDSPAQSNVSESDIDDDQNLSPLSNVAPPAPV